MPYIKNSNGKQYELYGELKWKWGVGKFTAWLGNRLNPARSEIKGYKREAQRLTSYGDSAGAEMARGAYYSSRITSGDRKKEDKKERKFVEFYNRGVNLCHDKKFTNSIKVFKKASNYLTGLLKEKEYKYKLLNNLGVALIMIGDREKAIKAWEEGINDETTMSEYDMIYFNLKKAQDYYDT